MRRLWLVLIVVVGIGTLANARPASAAGTPLSICNRSVRELDVAFGYHSSGINDTAGSNVLTGPFVSRGWLILKTGQCGIAANPFNARYMFWWGTNDIGLNSFGVVWSTNRNDYFCIPNPYGQATSVFTFEDENASKDECVKGKNIWVTARKVDLMVDATVNFTGN